MPIFCTVPWRLSIPCLLLAFLLAGCGGSEEADVASSEPTAEASADPAEAKAESPAASDGVSDREPRLFRDARDTDRPGP